MKFGIFSDIHLEFWNRHAGEINKLIDKLVAAAEQVDVMINAGDTHPYAEPRAHVRRLFQPGKYVEVMGNHDFYHGTFYDDDYKMYTFGDLKLMSGTLWTNFGNNPVVEWLSERQIYDFRCVEGISTGRVRDNFNRTVDYIELMKPDIVVTHFAPHPGSTHPKYAGQELNPYFVNNLSVMIEEVKPKLWVHGHVHDSFDYQVGETRIVCNPMGYPGEHRKTVDDYHVQIVEVDGGSVPKVVTGIPGVG